MQLFGDNITEYLLHMILIVLKLNNGRTYLKSQTVGGLLNREGYHCPILLMFMMSV
ncbi:MAG: hypothetical protein Barrevirus18_7 [Barrevirus sp.]|uniref:Uncharacterized protein n=1 Tax=Barrevirus sp. TaxID=2487763 RepID=A0A3G4ZUC4_9VIRU|nr:MAG: hypothetical protein Barrevirus18_7 [Barrevirus sp.]